MLSPTGCEPEQCTLGPDIDARQDLRAIRWDKTAHPGSTLDVLQGFLPAGLDWHCSGLKKTALHRVTLGLGAIFGCNLMAGAMRAIEVTEYSLDFEEVVVSGDYAFEWGTVRGTTRNVAGESSSPDESSAYKVLRVLRKNPEGRWRVHRAMWNAMPPE